MLGTSATSLATSTIVFAAAMAIVIARARSASDLSRFGPANVMTSVRAALVALVTGFIADIGHPGAAATALVIAVLVTMLDGVDGWIARRTRTDSAFGARFDMEVDAWLIVVLAVLAWQGGKAGGWILLAGLLRYAFVAAAWAWPWMARPLPPSFRRKTVCVVQIVALIVTLAPFVQPPASVAIAATSLLILAWSFFVDVQWLWQVRHAPAARKGTPDQSGFIERVKPTTAGDRASLSSSSSSVVSTPTPESRWARARSR